MSIDFTVYTFHIPEDLENAWVRALNDSGFRCELRPGTRLLDEDHETGPYLRVDDFPGSSERVRPDLPLLAGFGLSAVPSNQLREADVPAQARGCSHRVAFFTSAGRSPIDYALQVVGAAALAKVTQGIFVDPAKPAVLDGDGALELAARELRALNLEDGSLPWAEWPPETFDEESEYQFPPAIVAPKRKTWLQKLFTARIG